MLDLPGADATREEFVCWCRLAHAGGGSGFFEKMANHIERPGGRPSALRVAQLERAHQLLRAGDVVDIKLAGRYAIRELGHQVSEDADLAELLRAYPKRYARPVNPR